MRRNLPKLALRTTRVRLLASSYEDAVLGGPMDGGGSDSDESRLLLHGELWTRGSYPELARAVLACDEPRTFRQAFQGRRFVDQPDGSLVLAVVARLMPSNIYVPPEISENAGYLPSDAGVFEMPERESKRRWARVR